MMENPRPENTPLTYFPKVLKDFEVDFLEARKAAKNVITVFNLHWSTSVEKNGNVFKFKITLENREENKVYIFKIKCTPAAKKSLLSQKVEHKTLVAMKMMMIINGVASPKINYGSDIFPDPCELTVSQMLNHYAMITDSTIKTARIDLPPGTAPFPYHKGWKPEVLKLAVHESIKNVKFISYWLSYLPYCEGIRLTIHSEHHFFDLSEDSTFQSFLWSLEDLTIFGKCNIDMAFINKYENLKGITYNDPDGYSPISITDLVYYWVDNVNRENKRIRIALTCEHDVSLLTDRLVEKLKKSCPEGEYDEEKKEFNLYYSRQHRKSFKVDDHQVVLLIYNTP